MKKCGTEMCVNLRVANLRIKCVSVDGCGACLPKHVAFAPRAPNHAYIWYILYFMVGIYTTYYCILHIIQIPTTSPQPKLRPSAPSPHQAGSAQCCRPQRPGLGSSSLPGRYPAPPVQPTSNSTCLLSILAAGDGGWAMRVPGEFQRETGEQGIWCLDALGRPILRSSHL